MGEAFLDRQQDVLMIFSDIILYGSAATADLAHQVAHDIATAWNEPCATVLVQQQPFRVHFAISGLYRAVLSPEEVWYNDCPRNNYFRVEPFVDGDISFVDGIGSNTGYFKYANLLNGSTTAAHEYGHSLGLLHPLNLDYRGQGRPGMMYPRGTLVDPAYQYDPHAAAGEVGGTLNPIHRKVLQEEIELLKPERLLFRNNKAVIGAFTSIYHEMQLPPGTHVA